MSSSDTAISVRGISKSYTISHAAKRRTFRDVIMDRLRHPFHKESSETFWALDDISFDIHEGEAVGIIGRNGAGKSTLLKILSRITEPTAGRIDLYGRVGSLLEVGTGFHSELTGRENIFLNGQVLGMRKKEIDQQFDSIVDFAGVENFLDTPVKRYSSGMYVRLAFAVAAHLEPEILIVDEVLAVGDAEFQKRCLGKMGEVAKSGRTVLFVSHNMPAVEQLTTRAIVLHKGRIAFVGPTAEAVDAYARHARIDPATEYMVEHLPRSRWAHAERRVQFIKLKLANAHIPLAADEPILFDVTVRANQSVDPFRISATIFKMDGVPVGSFFTGEDARLTRGEVGTFRIEVAPPSLAPGAYYCGIAAGHGNYLSSPVDFDILMDVLHFEVKAEDRAGVGGGHWTPSWGAIRLPTPAIRRFA